MTLKSSISTHSKPCTTPHTRILKCFVLITLCKRNLVRGIIQSFEWVEIPGLRTGRLKKTECNFKRCLTPLCTCTSSNNTYVVIFVTKLDPLYILQAPFNLKCTMTLNPVVLVLTKELRNRIYRAKLLWKKI